VHSGDWINPQLRIDFGYRSEHVTALAAKAIARFMEKVPFFLTSRAVPMEDDKP